MAAGHDTKTSNRATPAPNRREPTEAERQALIDWIQGLPKITAATLAPLSAETTELVEKSIKEAAAIGDRANALNLMQMVHLVLKGDLPPSPTLDDWFAKGLTRIEAGTNADMALGTRRKPGRYPPLAEQPDLLLAIKTKVDEAIARGYNTKANKAIGKDTTCFEVVADELGLSDTTVKDSYYDWKVVETLNFPRPQNWPEHLPWPPA